MWDIQRLAEWYGSFRDASRPFGRRDGNRAFCSTADIAPSTMSDNRSTSAPLREVSSRPSVVSRVFPAGFTLDGAVAVSGRGELGPAVANGVASLIQKPLLAVEPSETGSRWRLLETIRSYALAMLRPGIAAHQSRDLAPAIRRVFRLGRRFP
jgi:hypothetical protein